MSSTSTNNNDVIVENPLLEQHQTSATKFSHIPRAKKKPMNPTPLEYSFWSTHPTVIIAGVVALYIGLSITLGVLIVYLTTPKTTITNCQLKFKKTVKNPIEYNGDPRSVAIGDFNNDTWLDLVVVNRGTHSISILLGFSNGTFRNSRTYPTDLNSAPCMVAVSDFNNDQRVDVVVANFGTNSISIFFGLGNGSFRNHTTISTGVSRPIWIHVTDLDSDTFLDIVTADYGTNSISILYGNGNGSFSYRMSYLLAYDSLPISIASGDFNNDHRLDLAIANSGTNNIEIRFADDNRNFSNQKTFTTGIHSHPNSITVGDFNDDNLLDIAVANYGTNSLGVFLNMGNGNFDIQMSLMLGNASPYSIGVGDINKDKRLDLVVSNVGIDNIGVLLGQDNGSFSKAIMYSTGSTSSVSVTVKDLNKDNLPDVAVVNSDTNSIIVLFGQADSFRSEAKYSTVIESHSQSSNDSDPPNPPNPANFQLNTIHAQYHSHQVRTRRKYTDDVCGTSQFGLIAQGPRSIAVGDFNNDTQLDIVVTIPSSYIGVFLGYGNGSFENQTSYTVGYSPNSVVVADFNNDNRADIVVSVYDDPSLVVLLGYGNGSFPMQTIYSNCSYFYSMMAADFDNDTRLDIVGIVYQENYVYVLLGYGNGTFADPKMYSTGNNPYSVAIGDFNNDTHLDIVVADSSDSTVSVLLGYGDGSFASRKAYATSSSPAHIAIGDFNNDNQLDIVVVANGYLRTDPVNVGVLLGYGDGSFAYPIVHSIDYSVTSVSVADFNEDDRSDIVITDYSNSKIRIFFGDGNGSFVESLACATSFGPWSTAIGDFDGDSRSDIAVTNYDDTFISVFVFSSIGLSRNGMSLASDDGSRLHWILTHDLNNDSILDILVINYGTQSIGVLLGYGDGTFQEQILLPLDPNSNPSSVIVGDFNRDNQLDLAVANSGSNNVDILVGNGTGYFKRQLMHGFSLNGAPFTIAAADFDHDGKSEVVVAYVNSDDIDILTLYDTGNFTEQLQYPIGFSLRSVAVGDFNNDNIDDIALLNSHNNSIGVLLGYGNGSFAQQVIFSTSTAAAFLAVDFNNDTILDIVFITSNDSNIGICFGYGNGSFANQMTYTTSYELSSAIVGDFNNDAFLDIALFYNFVESVEILFGYGNGSFSSKSTNITLINPMAGDFDNDAILDLLTPYYDESVAVFLGYGNGSFAKPIISLVDFSLDFVAAGDFNKDNRLDIFTLSLHGSKACVLLGYGNGSFAKQTTFSVGCAPVYASFADLNNDNELDIVISNQGKSNMTILLGYGNGSFSNPTLYSTGVYPSSIAFGDFNNDTLLDIVVPNSVNNTIGVFFGLFNEVYKYQKTLITGDGSRPKSFAINDFNNDTHMDISVVNSRTNNVGIFLGYGNSSFSSQMKYLTGSSPCSIAVGDLNNDMHLDMVVANCDDSTISILLGHGDGSFANQMLYSTGVASLPYSVSVADFDNDNFLDIIVANYGIGNVLVFVGHNNGTSEVPRTFSIGYGTQPFSVVLGDFNSDRKLDFAVANYGIDTLEIHLQTC